MNAPPSGSMECHAESHALQTNRDSQLEELRHWIDHAGHLLPAQGPITVFIHHNTLHAFEDLTFAEGVLKGARIFGCQPYLSEERYRSELARGRILPADVEAVLADDLQTHADERIAGLATRYEIRLAMLRHALRQAPREEVRWFVAETDALSRFRDDIDAAVRERTIEETRRWVMRHLHATGQGGGGHAAHGVDDRQLKVFEQLAERFGTHSIESWNARVWERYCLQALWRVCREGVHGIKAPAATQSLGVRHRDALLEATGYDIDRLVHDVLVRFCAAYLDQGFATWTLPGRERGFFHSFCELYGNVTWTPEMWLRGLATELRRQQTEQLTPLESIRESLDRLGVPQADREAYIESALLALRGWGGMIRQVELRADRVARPIAPDSVTELLAVRLILEQFALRHAAAEHLDYTGDLAGLAGRLKAHRHRHDGHSVEQRAFVLFQLAQLMGWLPVDLHRLGKSQWTQLVHEVEAFAGVERRRLFHSAYERRYRIKTLDALFVHGSAAQPRAENPDFQVICCLDEREESFRRHLEEVAPRVETFGAAGFFSVAMYYRGAADAHFVPLCPIVIRPQHWVQEEVVYSYEELHRRRAQARKALGTATHQLHLGSRAVAPGALLTAGLGILASVPLVARVLFPRLTATIRRIAGTLVAPPPATQLHLERTAPEPGMTEQQLGFTVPEMTAIAERLLQDIGLTSSWARIVVAVGHGSSSLNNPHKSAYDCGACGGGLGGPNARALAQMLNDPRIRAGLAERGLRIPETTIFVGAFHNTCNDTVTFFDLDRLPISHHHDFARVEQAVREASERNAHERCRRFMSAPLNMSFATAKRHVEGRSEDLAQTRPECGHATNALCIVGRRFRTRGLFLDRRAFLTSYDCTADTLDQAVLTRILSAIVPVCGGINLEYYFSYVDPTGWGCGTKLPHNVTALLGIMDGAASDLRPGLPWQMVEIHEPVRLLFIIENTPERMLQLLDRHPAIGRMFHNQWIQLATLDPDSPTIHVLRRGKFELYQPESNRLPVVGQSVDWYRGLRDHLDFAEIRPTGSTS